MHTFADMETAAHAIARGLPYHVAARAAGVDERTLRRWRSESPDFRRALDAAVLARRHEDAATFRDGWLALAGDRTPAPDAEPAEPTFIRSK